MSIITCIRCGSKKETSRKDTKFCSDTCRKMQAKGVPAAPKKVETKSKTEKMMEKLEEESAQAAGDRLMKRVGLGDWKQNLKLEYISTGFEELDMMISMTHDGEYVMRDGAYFGGFPRSAVSEIYGRKGVGKSNWLLRVLPRQVNRMLYIDTEGSTKEGPEAIPVPKNVYVIRVNTLETIWEVVNDAILEDDFDVIVVDGIAGITTNKELSDDNDPGGFQNRAKLISNWLRVMESKMRASRTAVIFTNQQKESFDPFKPKQTMGGAAVGYYCSLRLELLSTPSSAKIVRNGVKVGHKIRVKLDKSRFGPDGQETEFKFMFKDLAGGHESGTNKDS